MYRCMSSVMYDLQQFKHSNITFLVYVKQLISGMIYKNEKESALSFWNKNKWKWIEVIQGTVVVYLWLWLVSWLIQACFQGNQCKFSQVCKITSILKYSTLQSIHSLI